MIKKTKTKIEDGVHYFNIEEAIKYGVEKAIIIYNLRYWLKLNKANDVNIKDKNGKKYFWSFNSVSSYKEIFPYFTESSMQRWFKELEKDSVIIVGSFNKRKYDKTKWYTLPEFEIDETITQNGECISQNDEPIPDNKPQIINTDILDTKETREEVIDNTITLPKNRGTTAPMRLLYLYSKLFFNIYNVTYKADYKKDIPIIKNILSNYSELQVAFMLCVYFDWHGIKGSDDKEFNFVTSIAFPIAMFKTMSNKFEIYIKNVLNYKFEDDREMLNKVGEYLRSIE